MFQPALPIGGYSGWRFLNRTMETQQANFARSPQLQRDTAHFREAIGRIDSAEALVADRRLLTVALGAFGLQDDINNRFFIRKVLEDGTSEPRALANRLADKRYAEFARAFAFDGEVPGPQQPGFADRIAEAYQRRSFEVAIGAQDENMRLALTLERELAPLAERGSTERTKWLTVLGTPPLRRVFETAFGLPTGFGAMDIDRQVEVMRTRSRAAFGSDGVSQFAEPDRMESLVRRFLLRADAATSSAFGSLPPGLAGFSSGSAALQLLQSAPRLGMVQPGWRSF